MMVASMLLALRGVIRTFVLQGIVACADGYKRMLAVAKEK